MTKKKYKQVEMPRKNKFVDWFGLMDEKNKHSLRHAKEWQEKGKKSSIGGYVIRNPDGKLLPSTFATESRVAKKKLLAPALQRFSAVIHHLFEDWEKAGYEVVRVKLVEDI